MSLPTSIAFSENGNWANSPSVYYANHNEDTSIKKIKGLLNDRSRKCLGFTLQMKSIMN